MLPLLVELELSLSLLRAGDGRRRSGTRGSPTGSVSLSLSVKRLDGCGQQLLSNSSSSPMAAPPPLPVANILLLPVVTYAKMMSGVPPYTNNRRTT